MKITELLIEKVEDQVAKLKQGFLAKIEARQGSDPNWFPYASREEALADFGADFDKMVQADPSQQKKYLSWMVRLYLTNNLRAEDLNKAHEYLDVLNRGRIKGVDVNRFKNLPELYTVVEPYLEQHTQSQLDQQLRAKINAETYAVYQGPEGRILIPQTERASQFWGRGTQWCTAADNHCMYKYYSGKGKLYIIMPKDGRKFQLHVQERQLMDEKDAPVNVEAFVALYPWVKQHLKFSISDMAAILKYANHPYGSDLRPLLPKITPELMNQLIDDDPTLIIGVPDATPEQANLAFEKLIEMARKDEKRRELDPDDDYEQRPYFRKDDITLMMNWAVHNKIKVSEDLQAQLILLHPQALSAFYSGEQHQQVTPSKDFLWKVLRGNPEAIKYMWPWTTKDENEDLRAYAIQAEPLTYHHIHGPSDYEKALMMKSVFRLADDTGRYQNPDYRDMLWGVLRAMHHSHWVPFFSKAIKQGIFDFRDIPKDLQDLLKIMNKNKKMDLGEIKEQIELVEKFLDQYPSIPKVPQHRGKPIVNPAYEEIDVREKTEIEMQMRRLGWTFKGRGAYGSAWERPGDPMILKVFYQRDPAYMRFWSLAKRSDNPHFPEVGRLALHDFDLSQGKHSLYTVQIEKLSHTGPGWNEKAIVQLAVDSGRYLEGRLKKLPKLYTNRFPEWVPALDLIRPLKSEKMFIDLHSDNIMFRGRIPVIIDPLTD